MYNPPPALGAQGQPNEAVCALAFSFVQEARYTVLSTLSADGTPTTRGMELHQLNASGDLYFGTSKGKPFYDELKANPHMSAMAVRTTGNGLSIAVRVNAVAVEVADAALMDAFWQRNPGTKEMYSKNLDNFTLFHLTAGEGEIFHVLENAAVARVRFGFGGTAPRPFRYTIGSNCTGCGLCQSACMTGVIQNCTINHYGCLECGNCYQSCPIGAIEQI